MCLTMVCVPANWKCSASEGEGVGCWHFQDFANTLKKRCTHLTKTRQLECFWKVIVWWHFWEMQSFSYHSKTFNTPQSTKWKMPADILIFCLLVYCGFCHIALPLLLSLSYYEWPCHDILHFQFSFISICTWSDISWTLVRCKMYISPEQEPPVTTFP